MKKIIDTTKLIELYQRLSKREKAVLYASALFLTVMFADQLVIGPIYRNVHSMDQKIHDMESNIRRSIRLLSQKDRMMKEAAQYAAYTVSSKSAEEQTLLLLKQIQEIASKTSVNLLYVKPGTGGTEEGEGSVYRVNFECEGQMDQLINFFYAIENSKLLLRIEKYSLQPTAKGSSVIKCAATIAIGGSA